MPTVSAAELRSFTLELFRAAGVADHAAEIVCESLVSANLRGHDSHGVVRVPHYIQLIEQQRLNPAAALTVVRETATTLVGDGGWGLGQVVAHELLTRLMDKLQAAGIVSGTLMQAGHIGRLGEYAERAAERGYISLIAANTHGAAQRVAPVGGTRPRLGTNPICIGIPGGAEHPMIFDIGTSATAEGKVRVKRIAGEQVPPGWLLDPNGQPTTDPNQLYGDPPGTILPLGGDQAYKGFGLAFMIELLCAGLSGSPAAYPNPPPPIGNAAWFVLINPQEFAGTEHLRNEARQLEAYVRSVPKVSDSTVITLPGDPEHRVAAIRSQTGIPLDDGNWAALTTLATRLGVTPPVVGS